MIDDEVRRARSAYVHAFAKATSANMTDEEQTAVLAELAQLLVDMMDVCEQTLIAEPAIVAAYDALRARHMRPTGTELCSFGCPHGWWCTKEIGHAGEHNQGDAHECDGPMTDYGPGSHGRVMIMVRLTEDAADRESDES